MKAKKAPNRKCKPAAVEWIFERPLNNKWHIRMWVNASVVPDQSDAYWAVWEVMEKLRKMTPQRKYLDWIIDTLASVKGMAAFQVAKIGASDGVVVYMEWP